MPTLETIRKAALETVSSRYKIKSAVVRGMEEDKVLSTGRKLYRFHIASQAKPNDAAHTVVFDDASEEVNLAELDAREGKAHFVAGPVKGTPLAAATIDPDVNVLTLTPGDTFTEVITVKIPKSGAATKVDVYLLADTTASMGSILSAVQAGAANILSSLVALGADFQFGVGNYRDFPSDAYAFQHQQSLTNSAATVTTAINAWNAFGGGDGPEGQLFALDTLAQPPGGSIGWRTGAKRIIVWFGDYPGHDPVCAAISGGANITETSVRAKLVAEDISVLAISVLSPGLDDNPINGATDYTGTCGAPGGIAGQATRIAADTGGQFVSGINAGNIVNTIISLVSSTVGTINNVKLVPNGSAASAIVSITPASGYGPLAGDKDHELTFTVVFRGPPCKDEAQVLTGTIDAVADGQVIARKKVQITVPACKLFVYTAKFVCGTQPDCPCACTSVRPGKYSTIITIHNHSPREVRVTKQVIPLVLAGAPAGREPATVQARARDSITLPPLSSTMDDCCRLTELLFGSSAAGGLHVGFLEITASSEISVTAAYTSTGLQAGAVSIDVQEIRARRP